MYVFMRSRIYFGHQSTQRNAFIPFYRSVATQPPTSVINQARRWPVIGALGMAVVLGYYSTVIFASSSSRSCSHDQQYEHAEPTGRPSPASNMSAHDFDKSLDKTEAWSGILNLREKMAKQAIGDVLEVAVGTGRNAKYYTWSSLHPKSPSDFLQARGKKKNVIASYTGIDISADMLEVADENIRKEVPIDELEQPVVGVHRGSLPDQAAGSLNYANGKIRLVKTDAQLFIPLAPGLKKYDTVVQTFGLCSVSKPDVVLANLAAVTQLDTGKIILIEHGKGSYGIVNGMLDRSAPNHFSRFGCWWNRDIEGIVRAAVKEIPGLEVVKVERPWFQLGTLYWIELKVTKL